MWLFHNYRRQQSAFGIGWKRLKEQARENGTCCKQTTRGSSEEDSEDQNADRNAYSIKAMLMRFQMEMSVHFGNWIKCHSRYAVAKN